MKKFIPAFEINVQPSIKLKLIFTGSFLLALLSCYFNNLNSGAQLLLAISAICIVIYAQREGVLNYRHLVKIQCKVDGCWVLFDRHNKSEIYRLTQTSVILGSLFFLHFQSKTKKLNVVLASDSMTAEEARKLRVALRVYKNQLLSAKV